MQQILETGNFQALFSNNTTLADLRKLCQTLFEALQDKTLALNHQKKTNKYNKRKLFINWWILKNLTFYILYRILAKRFEDLENRLKSINQGEAIMSPTMILLNDYTNTSDETDIETSSVDG